MTEFEKALSDLSKIVENGNIVENIKIVVTIKKPKPEKANPDDKK